MYHRHGTLPAQVRAMTRKEFFECVLVSRDPETGVPDLEEDGGRSDPLEEAAVRNGMTPQAAREWAAGRAALASQRRG